MNRKIRSFGVPSFVDCVIGPKYIKRNLSGCRLIEIVNLDKVLIVGL